MSEFPWGIVISAYLFLGGVAGGAYVVGAWSDLFGKDKYRTLVKSGIYTSIVAILLGLVFLVLDLGRFTVAPLSVLNAYLRFPESMMSVGTWTITVFTIVSLATALLWLLKGNRLVIKVLEIVGMVLGFSTAAYTGILLSYARGMPFWGSPFLPWLFTISGISTGLALSALVIPIVAKFMPRLDQEFAEFFEQQTTVSKLLKTVEEYDVVLVVLEILTVVIFLMTAGGTSGVSALMSGSLSMFFWAFLAVGLIIPLGLGFYNTWMAKSEKTIIFNSLVGFILVLIGGFIIRYVVVIAGQL